MADTPQPSTPNPDHLSPKDMQEAARPVPSWPPPPTSSADDISVRLSQPTPDPFLGEAPRQGPSSPASAGRSSSEAGLVDRTGKHESGEQPAGMIELGQGFSEGGRSVALGPIGSSETDVVLPIRLSSEELSRPQLGPAASPEFGTAEDETEIERAGVPWPILLVASYASAVTMALVWMLWTGRGVTRPGDLGAATPFHETGRHNTSPSSTSPSKVRIPIPTRNQTSLHSPLRLGDLEVTPLGVAYRSVELVRLVGDSEDLRFTEPLLTLTIQIKNLSRVDSFAPLDAFLVRDTVSGPDEPCVELSDGRRIPLYRLSAESEWSVVGQDFPTLDPGESTETVLATEPIRLSDLSEPLIWHIKLRTGPFQTDVLGVRFSRADIDDQTQ